MKVMQIPLMLAVYQVIYISPSILYCTADQCCFVACKQVTNPWVYINATLFFAILLTVKEKQQNKMDYSYLLQDIIVMALYTSLYTSLGIFLSVLVRGLFCRSEVCVGATATCVGVVNFVVVVDDGGVVISISITGVFEPLIVISKHADTVYKYFTS